MANLGYNVIPVTINVANTGSLVIKPGELVTDTGVQAAIQAAG